MVDCSPFDQRAVVTHYGAGFSPRLRHACMVVVSSTGLPARGPLCVAVVVGAPVATSVWPQYRSAT